MKRKVHIVYCHPSKKSVTHSIKEGYIKGLEDSATRYTYTDLYENNFNPDISEKEYLRENNNQTHPYDEEIIQEQEYINNADILTFIFPLFWMDAPAKLVGYFSRIFTKGYKYGANDNEEGSMKKLQETNFIITTGSSFNDLKHDGKIEALKTVFVEDRLAGKTAKTRMYFFQKTSYEKELTLQNRTKYAKIARSIGRKTNQR